MTRTASGRPSLIHQLDKDVCQIVRKFIEEEDSGAPPHISSIYQRIKNSNSSLNRRPKKVLEESIERVLDVLRSDQVDNESAEIDDEMTEDPVSIDSNAMNRSIVGSWSTKPVTTNGSSAIHPNPETTRGKKRSANGEPSSKRARTIASSPPSYVRLEDMGGIGPIIKQLGRLLAIPLKSPSVYTDTGIKPPRGILLHGPPGCGKTMLANAFASRLGVPFISLSAPSVVSGMSGESEKALREYFDEAKKLAPCLMFIDEIDAITPKRESAQREMEKRIVAQLLTCMDDLAFEKTGGKPVIVIAATNRPDSLDPALRRGGRFDKEININIPTVTAREQILRALTRQKRLAGDLNFAELARRTPGYVGADLQDLVDTAGSAAIDRAYDDLNTATNLVDDMETDLDKEPELVEFDHLLTKLDGGPRLSNIEITSKDFFEALKVVQPSLKREGFATVPGTTWNDIGALSIIRKQLELSIVDPILHPQKYTRVGITAPSGVLLWGPPGCGKTLLAKAVANESKANFISVKGPELLNKFVGESERAIRQVFERARASAPCVIFFDEVDALVPRRDDAMSEHTTRVVNTLLTELDGTATRGGIYVLAATNRPDLIDPAMVRPGRLETTLYVDLPSQEERVLILETLLKDTNVVFDDTIRRVAEECKGFSGADLAGLKRQAGLNAIERDGDLMPNDFVRAKNQVKPSVLDIEKYRLKKAL